MTDFRALCEQLANELQEYINYAPIGPCDEEQALVDEARAALAQPAPERPTAKELRQIFDDQSGYIGDEQVMWSGDFVAAARAVLARWGNA